MTDTAVKELVDQAMIELVLDFPIFAQLVTRIGVKCTNSPVPAIAYTDGTGIYINMPYVDYANASPRSNVRFNRCINS